MGLVGGVVCGVVSLLTPPTAVDLGTAGSFAILSKAGISSVPTSTITGDIGVSPIAAHAITGFSLTASLDGTFSTSSQVVGSCYAADYTPPTPATLTAAITDMEAAYTDAAGRAVDVAKFNMNAGLISGMTFVSGVYAWDTGISFTTDIYIDGSATDIL